MHRTLCAFVVLLSSLALHGRAQDRVEAKLYQRVEGDTVQVAIEVKVAPDYHVYHEETGHPDAVGKPTKITLHSEDVEFGPLVWPEPHKHDQPEFGAWVWIHEGRFRVYALGEALDAESVEGVTASIDGQVCDALGCTLFKLELDSAGEGSERIWKDFPAEPAAQADASVAPGFGDFSFDPQAAPSGGSSQLAGKLYVRADGDTARAVLELEVTEGWHWYHHELGNPKAIGLPATVTLTGGGVEWGEVLWPAPEKFTDVLGEWAYVHTGTVVLRAEGALGTAGLSGDVGASVNGQACDDAQCLPVSLSLTAIGRGPDALFASWPDAEAWSESGASGGLVTLDGDGEGDGGLLAFLLAAFGSGLFALMMPCTYPMIPITISFFTKQADARGGKVLSLSLVYGAGIVLIFVLIGVIVGPAIIRFAQHGVTNLVIGILFLVFSLTLFGVMELRPPQFLMAAAGRASMRGGYLGVFLMGATLVVTSFTCTAPFVGGLLGGAAGEGIALGQIALGMAVFGLTMAVPFVFLALVPGRIQAMPRSGEWMNTLKVTLGFVEVAAALKFVSNADLVWQWSVLSRELFLLLWAAIFAVAAVYLFGWLKLKSGETGASSPGRLVGGLTFLTLALYCWHGFRGNELDPLMKSIAPPYSSQRVAGFAEAGGAGAAPAAVETHTVVKDDYEAARALAAREGKLLFVNFTGFT